MNLLDTRSRQRHASLLALVVAALAASTYPASQPALRDKTLVVWAAPADPALRGGSPLALDDASRHFDAVVLGEIAPRRWMPGSDFHRRTPLAQASWPEERAAAGAFVQVAIVYKEREITLYRDGRLYAGHTMAGAPQEYGADAAVLFGPSSLDLGDRQRTFAGRIRDARIYDRPLDAAAIARLQPGRVEDDPKPWAWWSFADEGLRERTGRFTELRLAGDVRLEGGALVLGGNGASVVARAALEPATVGGATPVPDYFVRSARSLRERLLADPYRPRYHFCVPEDMGQPGDPNGAFYHAGRYHLMYLYNRSGTGFSWGHVSSADLVHWRHHPDAIGPGDGDDGCFSGGAFVDDDGTAYLSYWMLWGARGIGLARSAGAPFDVWRKLAENPVIRSTEWGVTETQDAHGRPLFLGSSDPSNIWKKDGRYYVLAGNLPVLNKVGRAPDAPAAEQGDRLYLFESDDLRAWRYRHVFYERRPEWTDRSEDNMCASFLPLPAAPDGGAPSGRHLLLFISHNRGCQYYVGHYRDDRFEPTSHGRMSWVDNTYFAPEALVDGRGRQIMWAWLRDNPAGERERGWSGVYGLPRTLWLGGDGTLRFRPVPELERLRGPARTWSGVQVTDGASVPLPGIDGESCELALDLRPGSARRCGVKVRAAPDGREETLLYVDLETAELVFDATRSGVDRRKVVERAPLALAKGGRLSLRVFVDRSVVEVFAGDRQAIGRRVYPGGGNSRGVALFASGGTATFERVQAWDMAPANPF